MRMASLLLSAGVGLVLFANGAWMLADPFGWFAGTSIVWRTGPPNAHFIRDVGWTYGALGLLVGVGALQPRRRAAAVGTAAVWLAGHGAVHVGEAITGLCSPKAAVSESPAVFGPLVLLGLVLLIDRFIASRDHAS